MTLCLLSVVKNAEKVALLERAIKAHRAYTEMVRTAEFQKIPPRIIDK
jgi:hypothetical protein